MASSRSSADSSPMSRFSESDLAIDYLGTYDPNFSSEISNKMRVPKRIRIAAGQEGERGEGDEMNGNWRGQSSEKDKRQMQVPEKILVTGHERHIGAKSMPRELQLETVIMPPDKEIIRIMTPPRSITLLNAPPPRSESESYTSSNDEDETLIVENDRARFQRDNKPNGVAVMTYDGNSSNNTSLVVARRGKRDMFPSLTYGQDDDADEIEHLREQMSRINRRLLAVEEDTSERKERERYLVMAGLVYVAYKTVTWLFRAGPQR